jgi:competence protein ComEC
MSPRGYPWKQAPFLRLLPPILVGIFIAGNSQGINSNGIHISTGIFIILLSFYKQLGFSNSYNFRWFSGVMINCLLVLTGIQLIIHQQITVDKKWIGKYYNKAELIAGSPQGISSPGKTRSKVFFDVSFIIESSGRKRLVTGTIIIYVPKEDQQAFLPGDTWLLSGRKIKKITSSRNPGEFDYALYCSRKNIFHQVFLKKSDYVLYKKSTGFNLARFLAKGQLSALSAIRKNVPGDAQSLAMALLIGYRDEVDKELLQAYTNTGVVHVIAVSGMHLGLIFLLLQHLLIFPVGRFPSLKWLKALLVLIIIWWFSGVAGGAASIIRAAFMFTIVMISKLFRKSIDPFQSLAFGAFALLCYNPFWLWDAGFQLSFAALLSIVLFQPWIQNAAEVSNKILNLVWQLTAVTLSAQILTLPISIGQFHQAPVYFLAANILAVPLSSIALITAIIQWIISACGIENNYAGQLTGILINWMNAGIRHFNKLPGSIIDQLEWSLLQIVMAYAIIVFCTIWIFYRNKFAFFACLAGIILFTSIRFVDCVIKTRQKILLVYHIPGKTAVEIMNGRTSEGLCYSMVGSPVLSASHRNFRIRKIRPQQRNAIVFNGILIFIATDTSGPLPVINRSPVYLILNSGNLRIKSILSIHPGTFVVIDGSVPEWKASDWQKELNRLKVPCHNTWEAGAFICSLNNLNLTAE